jgi:hypothetical protein
MAFRRKADRAQRHQHSVQDTHRRPELDEDHKDLQLGLNRQNCELRSSLGRLPGGLSFCSKNQTAGARTLDCFVACTPRNDTDVQTSR